MPKSFQKYIKLWVRVNYHLVNNFDCQSNIGGLETSGEHFRHHGVKIGPIGEILSLNDRGISRHLLRFYKHGVLSALCNISLRGGRDRRYFVAHGSLLIVLTVDDDVGRIIFVSLNIPS